MARTEGRTRRLAGDAAAPVADLRDVRNTYRMGEVSVHALLSQGRTIMLITHEEEVAEHGRWVIRIRDGEIVDDRRTQPDASVR